MKNQFWLKTTLFRHEISPPPNNTFQLEIVQVFEMTLIRPSFRTREQSSSSLTIFNAWRNLLNWKSILIENTALMHEISPPLKLIIQLKQSTGDRNDVNLSPFRCLPAAATLYTQIYEVKPTPQSCQLPLKIREYLTPLQLLKINVLFWA